MPLDGLGDGVNGHNGYNNPRATALCLSLRGGCWRALWHLRRPSRSWSGDSHLGFGIRKLNYLFFENENENATEPTTRANVVKSFRRKALLSAVAGLSLAAFFHGSSLFVPAGLREQWVAYHGQCQCPWICQCPWRSGREHRKHNQPPAGPVRLHRTNHARTTRGQHRVMPLQLPGRDLHP